MYTFMYVCMYVCMYVDIQFINATFMLYTITTTCVEVINECKILNNSLEQSRS
jgi:hypothetical protein